MKRLDTFESSLRLVCQKEKQAKNYQKILNLFLTFFNKMTKACQTISQSNQGITVTYQENNFKNRSRNQRIFKL